MVTGIMVSCYENNLKRITIIIITTNEYRNTLNSRLAALMKLQRTADGLACCTETGLSHKLWPR